MSGPYRISRSVRFQFTRSTRAAIVSRILAQMIFIISIHATPAGRDATISMSHTSTKTFQFTRPIRAAIRPAAYLDYRLVISIHATHTGRDASDREKLPQFHLISIHATHTGRDSNIQQMLAINSLRFSYIPYKKAWIRS